MRQTLTDSEAEEIDQDLVKALEKAKNQLERLKNLPLEERLFRLEYFIVSSLYYRLEKHLLDWCTKEHPVQRSEYGQYRMENNLRYNDIPPVRSFVPWYDPVHQLPSSEEEGGAAARDASGTV